MPLSESIPFLNLKPHVRLVTRVCQPGDLVERHHIFGRLAGYFSVKLQGFDSGCDHIFPDIKFQQNCFIGIGDPGAGNIPLALQRIILVKGRWSRGDVLVIAIELKNFSIGFGRYPGMVSVSLRKIAKKRQSKSLNCTQPVNRTKLMAALFLNRTLAKCPLFKDFTPEEIQQILQSSRERKLEAGEVLIRPGYSNDTLYLLIEGELSIVLENDDRQVSFPIKVGECLGEMSLVMGRPTSGLAVAQQPSLALCIPENIFWGQIAMTQKGVRNLMSVMASRLRRSNYSLMRELEAQLKYQHLQKELDTAGKIQADIVPDGDKLLLNRPAVDAYALINQARIVGGDFYDALMLDDEHLYLAIGDISGKGMPAALLMMRTFASLRLLAGNDPSFQHVIPSLNNMLAHNNDDMMFVTIFAGVLHLRTGVLRYVNGGHNPPFLSLGGGDYQLMDLPSGTLVGIEPQAQFIISELRLKPGDSLLLYTDGITEAMNSQKMMFETGRMKKVLNQRKHPSMKALVRSLENAVKAFVGNAQQHDDFTILALRYLGNAGRDYQ